MSKSWLRFGGLIGVSLGTLSLAATGFLTYWAHASHGEHDIAARGGILLFVLLPWILLSTWILVSALSAILLRPSGLAWSRILGSTAVAFVVAAALELMPPLLLLPRSLALIPSGLRPGADLVLAGLLIVAGALIVNRASGPRAI